MILNVFLSYGTDSVLSCSCHWRILEVEQALRSSNPAFSYPSKIPDKQSLSSCLFARQACNPIQGVYWQKVLPFIRRSLLPSVQLLHIGSFSSLKIVTEPVTPYIEPYNLPGTRMCTVTPDAHHSSMQAMRQLRLQSHGKASSFFSLQIFVMPDLYILNRRH